MKIEASTVIYAAAVIFGISYLFKISKIAYYFLVKKPRCKTQVKAIITDKITRTNANEEGTTYSYAFCYHFEYEGQSYDVKSKTYHSTSKNVGDPATLNINENNPKEFTEGSFETKQKIIELVVMIAVLLLVVFVWFAELRQFL